MFDLLLGRVGVAFIERRLSLLILFIIFFAYLVATMTVVFSIVLVQMEIAWKIINSVNF
jgi:hypothetical protein